MRVDVGRLGSGRRASIASAGAEELKPCLDVRVAGVELSSALIGIKRVGNLVVARFVLGDRSATVSDSRARDVAEWQLTSVPRSYHTSEMYGFSRMARE